MKISKSILLGLKACSSGLNRFIDVHGSAEIDFADCIKSRSNTVSDYLWFIGKQKLSDSQLKDVRLFAVECAERVLPIFEKKYPENSRPRKCLEVTRSYLDGNATIDELRIARRDADYANYAADAYAAYAAAADAAAAYAAADYADYAAYAAYAADAAYAAAYAADAADAAYAAAYAADAAAAYAAAADAAAAYAAAAYAERRRQLTRLEEIVRQWGES